MAADELITIALTPDERRIISGLRDIPASPLRDLSREVIIRLLEFVREPKCAEMQGDGVPCDRSEADCEQCTRLREIVESLKNALPSVV